MGIRKELQPFLLNCDGKIRLAKSCFSMTPQEKALFCKVLKRTLPRNVAIALIKLGDFFRGICSKVVKLQDLEQLQLEIVETIFLLEMNFPPCFFDIMVHLPIHLVDEIKLGGPVHCHYMYPIERYLCKLKSYVRNRSRPEGSIAEGCLAEECLIFCSRYMHDGVKTRFSRYWRNDDMATVRPAKFQFLE